MDDKIQGTIFKTFMISIKDKNEWQWIDQSCGLIYPWFTRPFLDVLTTWDLKDKNILEFGGGASSIWFAKKAKFVFTVETNFEWYIKIMESMKQMNLDNYAAAYAKINEGDQSKVVEYVNSGEDGIDYDIIVNDGILRTEICQYAIDYFHKKNKSGILICDNWIQSYVWISPKAEEIMKPYKSEAYEQEDHKDNDGINKWKTAVFYIE